MKIEVCVDRIDDALAAAKAGAERIEMNYALGLGGLTPALSSTRWLVEHCSASIVAMVRPHAKDFVYSDDEAQLMLEDCHNLLDCGVQGIVAGRLTNDGSVDKAFVAKMVERCGSKEFIFHRAFDEIEDQFAAAETLIGLGVTRVLTSGGEITAWEGRIQLAKLQQAFGERIQFLPGSGVNLSNASDLAHQIGVRQLHGSFKQADKVCVDTAQIRALCAL